MSVVAVAAIAGAALRVGGAIANYGTLDPRINASLVSEERERIAVDRQISDIDIQVSQLAGERLASLQRDLGTISVSAAAQGVTGGASLASARATTAGAAAQTQARTVSQATRTIRNLTERKAAMEEARKQERKNMRIGVITGTVETAAKLATQDTTRIAESFE